MKKNDVHQRRKRKQEYKPVDPSIAKTVLKYRDDLIEVQLKIVEIALDGRNSVKKEKIGLSCVNGHTFDHWQAICPKCYRAEQERIRNIELRNKHLESVIKSILGDMEL